MDMVVVTNGGYYTNYLLLEQKNFVIVKKLVTVLKYSVTVE